ncbi:unnamed protein product [Arabis nemorensis]|uniref:F-box protein At3g26010-like beta-propeller domain-containing protein n=1 Tax=Arabis nemorensis TaxID=586526 RepID=A0A565BGE6_9BRAS|nr:unnamed protein product [Arabis nemorensis]
MKCAKVLYFTGSHDSVNLNGMLYMWGRRLDPNEPDILVAHGLEADDKCRVIPLPLPYNKRVKRCLTTSRGDVMYIEILDRRLKVWRLNNNNNSESSECWQLLRGEITMTSIQFDVDCIPLAMNPFDSDIVYLWNLQHSRLVGEVVKVVIRPIPRCIWKFGLTKPSRYPNLFSHNGWTRYLDRQVDYSS